MIQYSIDAIIGVALSDGAIAGLIGSIVNVASKVFRKGEIKIDTWAKRTLYIAVGWLLAAAYFKYGPLDDQPSPIECFILGALWIHLPYSIKTALDVWIEAKIQLKKKQDNKDSDNNSDGGSPA